MRDTNGYGDRGRNKLFANCLHKENIFETFRVHRTLCSKKEGASVCKLHMDGQNSRLESYSHTVWFAKMEDTKEGTQRLGAVCYTRQSIDEYLERSKKHGSYLRECMSILKELPNYRKQIDHNVIPHLQPLDLPNSLRLKQVACNLDPALFL